MGVARGRASELASRRTTPDSALMKDGGGVLRVLVCGTVGVPLLGQGRGHDDGGSGGGS